MISDLGTAAKQRIGAPARTRSAGGSTLARRWVRLALLSLVAIIVALVVAAAFSVHRMYTLGNARYLKQAAPVYAATQDVLVQMLNQETAVRGFVATGDETTLAPYYQGQARERRQLDRIAANASSDPRIPQQLARVRAEVRTLERYFARQIALVRSGPAGRRLAQQQVLAEKADFDRFRSLTLGLEVVAGNVVARARHEQRDTYRMTAVFIVGAGLVAVGVALALLLSVPARLYRLYRAEERARRAAEEGAEAARALTHVAEAVILTDDDGRVRYWNPSATQLFGPDASAARGRPIREVAPALAELSDAAGGPAPVTLPSGERWLGATESPFDGGRVVVVRDLTPDHELERVRSEFVATAAHELRTPLAAIYGSVRTLRRPDCALPPETREQFLAMIESESERLRTLMDQLLVTAQLDREAFQVGCEPVDLAAVCRSAVEAAEPRLSETLRLESSFDEAGVTVRADPDRLRQVLANLLDNAIKYSPDGGRIEVRVTGGDGVGVVDVVDEGIGIPADEQDRVFEKFYRLDPDMTHGVGGSGLGLYIIRELVDHMGGRVTVRSQPSHGSTFTVALPLA